MILSLVLPIERLPLILNEPPIAPEPVTLNDDNRAWPDICKPEEGIDTGEYDGVE